MHHTKLIHCLLVYFCIVYAVCHVQSAIYSPMIFSILSVNFGLLRTVEHPPNFHPRYQLAENKGEPKQATGSVVLYCSAAPIW